MLAPLLAVRLEFRERCNLVTAMSSTPGFQQAAGKNFVFSGDYIWKYTHNAFDFSVLGNTPITFPIDWHNSKIPGFALRADVPNFHNFSAFVVMSSVAARFFPPQSPGRERRWGTVDIPSASTTMSDLTRQRMCSTRYQGQHAQPWIGFNWRFDSGLVAGSVPCYNLASNDLQPIRVRRYVDYANGQPGVDLSESYRGPGVRGGSIVRRNQGHPTTPLPSPCPAAELTLEPGESSGSRDGERRQESAAHPTHATCSTPRLATTTSSRETATSGVFA